jgi:hypothetical protein
MRSTLATVAAGGDRPLCSIRAVGSLAQAQGLMTEHDGPPLGFGDPAWDFALFAAALAGGVLALSTRHPVVAAVLCIAALVALQVRIARRDTWNRLRGPTRRLGAGSKWNHTFSLILLVLGAQAAFVAAWNAMRS